MKIFILQHRDDADYSSLPKDAELINVFHQIKGAPDIPHIKQKLESVLDTADLAEDFIIFSGPSYLCAYAGFYWFTRDGRVNANYYAYNLKDRKYTAHTEEL